ncbi:MAG: SPFH domain-containing protein [Clostridiales bacterium]|jgi:membrane protease subunit (stomatin/prohibitin family)|nr:SPFH domain-containing protein [Clostridiales bacterium]
MGRIRNELLKVIEWSDSSSDTIAYKFAMPEKAEIMNGSQLIVRESQVGVLVSSGKVADIFEPGRYKLDTDNMPILTKLMSWKYAFESPFKADVYFINTKQFINQKWGTSSPVMMRDQDFGMVQFRGYGVFTFKVGDPYVFLTELLGTGASYKVSAVVEQLKRTIVSGISESVAASNIPALDLAMRYSALGEGTINIVRPKFALMGINLIALDVENLSLTEESQAAMNTRTRMTIIGDANTYTQFQAADSMKTVAENAHKGSGMNIPGMGMGLGTGFAMTNMFAGNIAGSTANAQATAAVGAEEKKRAAAAETAPVACPKCGRANKADAKFCLDCGEKLQVTCPKCGFAIKTAAKFCPECGERIASERACPKCGKPAKPGTRFCEDCGTRLD